jgi:hypothetical protein
MIDAYAAQSIVGTVPTNCDLTSEGH